MNFRERWYAEHNLPYEPPKLNAPPPWRSVGNSAGLKTTVEPMELEEKEIEL